MAALGVTPAAEDLALKLGNTRMKAEFPSEENLVGIADGIAVAVCGHFKRITPVALAINAKEATGLTSPSEQGLIRVGVHVGDDGAASFNDRLAL
jgi:hypothetical protein